MIQVLGLVIYSLWIKRKKIIQKHYGIVDIQSLCGDTRGGVGDPINIGDDGFQGNVSRTEICTTYERLENP